MLVSIDVVKKRTISSAPRLFGDAICGLISWSTSDGSTTGKWLADGLGLAAHCMIMIKDTVDGTTQHIDTPFPTAKKTGEVVSFQFGWKKSWEIRSCGVGASSFLIWYSLLVWLWTSPNFVQGGTLVSSLLVLIIYCTRTSGARCAPYHLNNQI